MALYGIVKNDVFVEEQPAGIAAKLVYSVMLGVYKKLYARAVEKRSKYTITLLPAEAFAFFLLYNNYPLEPASFEGNLITTICNNIHQKYA